MRKPAQNEADVLDESQIEHTVRFIQDGDLDVSQFEYMLLEVIDDAPRGADEHVDALLQDAPLLVVVDAAEHDRELKAGVFADALGVGVDLHGEFARRRDHDGARRVDRSIGGSRIGEQAIEQCDEERCRLARAGLRLARHVAAGERQGQGLRLNRRAAREAEFGNTPFHGFRDVERIECELTEMGV